jgi:hypothetical protein
MFMGLADLIFQNKIVNMVTLKFNHFGRRIAIRGDVAEVSQVLSQTTVYLVTGHHEK